MTSPLPTDADPLGHRPQTSPDVPPDTADYGFAREEWMSLPLDVRVEWWAVTDHSRRGLKQAMVDTLHRLVLLQQEVRELRRIRKGDKGEEGSAG